MMEDVPHETFPADDPRPAPLDAPHGEPDAGPVAPDDADAPPAAPPLTRRVVTQTAALLVAALALAGLLAMPTGYVVRLPGPTYDTLGEDAGAAVITVAGTETFPSTGQLRFTTVSALGNQAQRVPVGRLLRAWVDPDEGVYPVEALFPSTLTPEETEQTHQAEMVSSQESASVAALRALGREVGETLTAVATDPTMGAVGIVEDGDVVVALDGTPVSAFEDLSALLDGIEPGDVAVVRVVRDGVELDLPVTTSAGPADRAYLGISLDRDFDLPVDVTMHIDRVGGPSAGLMFALGIMDMLTPEDETGGATIAGTGTIGTDGAVGPIGGITYKMRGALADGATWFLAPTSNCAEVVGDVPDGLGVVAVGTLDEAWDAVAAIGAGQTEDLPTCS